VGERIRVNRLVNSFCESSSFGEASCDEGNALEPVWRSVVSASSPCV